MRQPHIVPLARQSVAILQTLKETFPTDYAGPYVFPGLQPDHASGGADADDAGMGRLLGPPAGRQRRHPAFRSGRLIFLKGLVAVAMWSQPALDVASACHDTAPMMTEIEKIHPMLLFCNVF